jgi:GrpB-like predicted nucleotidyltransferase (UPF0157 family)
VADKPLRIAVVEYDPRWPELFRREAERIRTALGSLVRQLQHTGSTAVPGLAAKPVIDILLAVERSADEAAWLPLLEDSGYRLRLREPEWFEHRMLKGPDTDVNLHVLSAGCSEIAKVLRFRDWLCAHPDDRDLYARTKLSLAQREWTDVDGYARAKTVVIEDILGRAR